MRHILVTGDPDWDCPEFARKILARLKRRHGRITLVLGDEPGVERAVAHAARDLAIPVCAPGRPATGRDVDFALFLVPDVLDMDGMARRAHDLHDANIPVYVLDDRDGSLAWAADAPPRPEVGRRDPAH